MFDKKGVIIIFFIFICSFAAHAAEYVYSWTDESGVRIFSDKPPVTEVTDLEKSEKIASTPGSEEEASNQGTDKALEIYSEDDTAGNGQDDEQENAVADEPEEKINPEIESLEKEIEQIRKRGLGPRYTQGMKDNQIDIINKKIEILKEKP